MEWNGMGGWAPAPRDSGTQTHRALRVGAHAHAMEWNGMGGWAGAPRDSRTQTHRALRVGAHAHAMQQLPAGAQLHDHVHVRVVLQHPLQVHHVQLRPNSNATHRRVRRSAFWDQAVPWVADEARAAARGAHPCKGDSSMRGRLTYASGLIHARGARSMQGRKKFVSGGADPRQGDTTHATGTGSLPGTVHSPRLRIASREPFERL
eukprot:360908-Chlamydomonas_euryale.AAC.21